MLTILRKSRLKDKELRLLVLGLDNAGKTTIVKHLLGEDPTTISPTLGFIISTLDFEGYKLNICPSPFVSLRLSPPPLPATLSSLSPFIEPPR